MFAWLLVDVPTCPQCVHATDVFSERCRLNWNAPSDSGGADIIGEISQAKQRYSRSHFALFLLT